MTFTIQNGNFNADGRKVFLNSGEIHYFRIKRELWDKHLSAAVEAGLTTVSTYIPWAWHEPEEQVFDFTGATSPERDLQGWLQLCQAHGLQCIVKPGPFILAEFRGAGLPDWFLERYAAEVRMHDSHGNVVMSDGVSLFHPSYLEKVTLWYDRIMPFISERQLSRGGPVIMMQVCNEIGVFSWLAHQADYGSMVRTRFIAYLTSAFTTIEELNALWGTAYPGFSDVELPPDGRLPYTSAEDRGRDYAWHCFWRRYYGDYLRMLCGMARERGVTLPVYHNLPGWIYGSGYEFPVNITMYDDLFGDRSELAFGVDHIPEYLSYRNMHDDRIINDIVSSMQGDKPLFAAEFQSGSREYHVVTNPREMELFYKASVANGLTGWNYYMFSQGRNPRCKGYSGETFYWFTPLTPEGDRTSAFPLVKKMSSLVKVMENLIVEAHRKAEVCVLFYPPYYATELERPVDGNCALQFTPSAIRRPAYFDGLLKALQVLNVDYDMADLTKTAVDALRSYKQVWAFCTDEMNGGDQQTLVDYAKAGGGLVIFPYLPDREMSQKPCTIIRDALGISPSGKEIIDSPLIDIMELHDIKCANPVIFYDQQTLGNAEIIARTISGQACGFSKKTGLGTIIHLGTWTGFDTEGHKPVYESLLARSGARLRQATASNDQITVRERFTSHGEAIMFAGNYYNEEITGHITYTHPGDREEISIPYLGGDMVWPPLHGVLSPVSLEISNGIRLLHSTSDILGIKTEPDCLEITLQGDRDMAGEMVFEGPGAKKIGSASLDNVPVKMADDGSRTCLNYNHMHNKTIVLSIKLNENV